MEIKTTSKGIEISLPLTTPTGKVRVKRPMENQLSIPVSTKSITLEKTDYLEWQISYDTDNLKESSIVKELILNKQDGVRYGCELAKILLEAYNFRLITKDDMTGWLEFAQQVQSKGIAKMDRIQIVEAVQIPLSLPEELGYKRWTQNIPNYLKHNTHYSVEIKLFPKQKAVGVQPMIYIWLPLEQCMTETGASPVGRTAQTKEKVKYIINQSNTDLITDTVKAFCLASEKHNADMVMILEAILKR